MMTKRMYCETIVKKWCDTYNKSLSKAHEDIYASSNLAVALEYLDMLSPEEVEYSSTRGGIVEVYREFDDEGNYKNSHILSVRDMISLLPDTLDN